MTNVKILMASDDERSLQTMARDLTRAGYTILTAGGGKQALQLYERERPDVTLVKARMPHMDGFAVLQTIREQDPEAEVLLTAGQDDTESFVAALRAGASDFVSHPTDPEILVIALQRAQERLRLRREIAEHRRKEEKLEQSQRRLQALFDSFQEAILLANDEARCVDANPAACALLGYSREELLQLSLWDVTPVPGHKVGSALWRAFTAEGERSGQHTLRRDDGESIEVECRAVANIVPGLHASVLRDVTKRKRAEEALRESEQIFQRTFAAIPDPTLLWERQRDGRIIMAKANSAAQELSQGKIDDFLGTTAEEFFDHAPQAAANIKHTFDTGKKQRVEMQYRMRTTGEEKWIIADYVKASENYVLNVIRDVTERVRTERLLRALNEAALAMEKALTPKEIFAAVAKELEKLDFSCAVFPTDENQSRLFTRYLSFESQVLKAAEKLAGHSHEGFSIPIEAIDLYREVVWETRTVFARDAAEAILRQLLPQAARRLAGQIASLLKAQNSIVAPLIVGDEVIGVLSVQSASLTEDDVPTITAFAHQVAAAWQRAQLFEQVQRELVERKQAEEALRESEERHRGLIESSDDMIFSVDRAGAFKTAGGARLREFELTPEEVVGRSLEDLFGEEARQYQERHQQVFESGKAITYEHTFEFAGVTKTDLTTVYPVKSVRGNVELVGVICRDITERKRAEEERERLLTQIQDQARQMQQIIHSVPDGMLLLDAEQRILLVNPAARQYLYVLAGAREGEILSHLGDRPVIVLLTSPPQGLWHSVTADETDHERVRQFEVIARPIEASPQAEGWVMVIRDVTQEREVQRRVQQQERLAAVGRLAAGIAHDFNNIMATIVLYAEMASRAEGLPTREQERMATINQQAMHATRLIRQILDFSRRSVLERQPLDLVPLLKEQIKLLKRTMPEDIQVSLAYGPDDHTVTADLTSIQQVVMNLALNARDAMPEGGELHLKLGRIRFEDSREAPLPEMETGEWVRVTVSDTGTGIPPEDLPHVFDPFYTTKAPGEGTGLGLAQVYGIVTQHKGFIDVRSQTNQGTTFTIYLPALPKPSLETPTQGAPDLVRGKGETILVVEDDPATKRALVDSLEMLNYRVLEAANGHEALATLERYHDEVALVLSDVVMPKMGGIALLHALRERELTVGVVMLTGHPLGEKLENLREQGMIDWMTKPPKLEQLAQLLARALND
jgi:PAS domain S-box-containing protein